MRPGEVVAAKRDARDRLNRALQAMPDESFGWLLFSLTTLEAHAARLPQIWPDALGGFTSENRAAITEVRAAADALVLLRREAV